MDFEGVSPIGEQVARYRKAAKMSGEELAQAAGAGLTRSIIANLENGRKHDVTVAQLIALAYVLGASPAELLYNLMDPYAEVPIVSSERFTVTAQQWHAHDWFTENGRQWRFPVTVDGDAEQFHTPRITNYRSRRYLVQRRGELLGQLELLEEKVASWLREASETLGVPEYQARLKLSDTQEWKALEDQLRDVKAELYEVDGQLRRGGVNIDRTPRLDEGAPF